tara:strand:+ start:614 stop:988 length:375 start_codon:yes stop_codon:yes gene_type:complete
MGKVLVVDDFDAITLIVDTFLNMRGYETLTAYDGVTGLKAFMKDRDQIDLIITDLNMPRMDGLEMLDKIRQSGAKMPAIVMSARSEVDEERAKKVGVAAWIKKPLESEKVFFSVFEKVLAGPKA